MHATDHQNFLNFLIEETIAGRAGDLSVERIGEHLYGDLDEKVTASRVTGSMIRLRARLADYYRDEGHYDPLRVDIDVDTWEPTFEIVDLENRTVLGVCLEKLQKHWALAMGLCVCVLVAIYGTSMSRELLVVQPPIEQESSLEAQSPNGADGGLAVPNTDGMSAREIEALAQDYLIQMPDMKRQYVALELARRALAMEPADVEMQTTLALAMLNIALLAFDTGRAKSFLLEAEGLLTVALEAEPDSSWVLIGNATLAYAKRDFERTIEFANRAYRGGLVGTQTKTYFAMLMSFSGEYEASNLVATQKVDPSLVNTVVVRRTAFLSNSFYLGDYQTVVDHVEALGADMLTLNALQITLVAAAYQMLGDQETARALTKKSQDLFPTFRPENLIEIFYRNPQSRYHFLEALAEAGWDFDR
ncbi:tetratricopeptide repeat protein [Shimia sp.]|uniref:tetratricopeptide repeat protein n=1 Tax=Shimia sp. TaxID=1954381 RepID=UPI003B8D9A3C